MSESNADTTADEQTVAELKERIGELEERVEQQEAQRGTSRRQFLGSLTGIASAGAAGYYLGTQRASAAPSWGSASGQMGTQATPLSDVIAQTGTFQSASTRLLSNAVESATVSNGSITVSSSLVAVNGENGSSDTVTTINGGSEGDILELRRGDANITIQHNTGTDNVILNNQNDFTMDNIHDSIFLRYYSGRWSEISRSNNL